MNWEAIGALGEVAAALGVVATLFYLALQIRFGAQAKRWETQQAVMTEIRAGISLLIADAHLAETYAEFRETGDVSKPRRAQFELWVSNQFRIYEDIHTSYRNGFVEHEFWRSRRDFMRDFYLSTPLVRRSITSATTGPSARRKPNPAIQSSLKTLER